MFQINIVGVGWFCGGAGGDEFAGEPEIAGITVDGTGDEVDCFLGNDVGAGHGDLHGLGGGGEDDGLHNIGVPVFLLLLFGEAEAHGCHAGGIFCWVGVFFLRNDVGMGHGNFVGIW